MARPVKKPDKKFVMTSFKTPPELRDQLIDMADADDRPLSSMIRVLVNEALAYRSAGLSVQNIPHYQSLSIGPMDEEDM